MLDDKRFKHLADVTFRAILDAFDTIDADDADVETAGNTLQITFRGGRRAVVNTQSATHQIWLAGGQSGWHFDYDETSERWLHAKGTGDELFAVLSKITVDAIGKAPSF